MGCELAEGMAGEQGREGQGVAVVGEELEEGEGRLLRGFHKQLDQVEVAGEQNSLAKHEEERQSKVELRLVF